MISHTSLATLSRAQFRRNCWRATYIALRWIIDQHGRTNRVRMANPTRRNSPAMRTGSQTLFSTSNAMARQQTRIATRRPHGHMGKVRPWLIQSTVAAKATSHAAIALPTLSHIYSRQRLAAIYSLARMTRAYRQNARSKRQPRKARP